MYYDYAYYAPHLCHPFGLVSQDHLLGAHDLVIPPPQSGGHHHGDVDDGDVDDGSPPRCVWGAVQCSAPIESPIGQVEIISIVLVSLGP